MSNLNVSGLKCPVKRQTRRDTCVYKCTFISHMSVFIQSPRDSKLQDGKGLRNF